MPDEEVSPAARGRRRANPLDVERRRAGRARRPGTVVSSVLVPALLPWHRRRARSCVAPPACGAVVAAPRSGAECLSVAAPASRMRRTLRRPVAADAVAAMASSLRSCRGRPARARSSTLLAASGSVRSGLRRAHRGDAHGARRALLTLDRRAGSTLRSDGRSFRRLLGRPGSSQTRHSPASHLTPTLFSARKASLRRPAMRSSSLPPTSGMLTRTSQRHRLHGVGAGLHQLRGAGHLAGLPGDRHVERSRLGRGRATPHRCTRSIVAPTNFRANDGTSDVPWCARDRPSSSRRRTPRW